MKFLTTFSFCVSLQYGNAADYRFLLARFNATAALSWARIGTGSGLNSYDEGAIDLSAESGTNNYVLAGYTSGSTGYDTSGNDEILLIKVTTNRTYAQLDWAWHFVGLGTDRAYDFQAAPDGDYLISGYTGILLIQDY